MTNRLRMPAVLALALILAGCAVTRPPSQVEAPMPPQFYAPLPHGGQLADMSRWWDQLQDPVLVSLIDAAQAASPTIAAAATRIETARATRVAASAALLPNLDATASANRGFTQPPIPLATTVQAGLQTQWEIDLFGGNRATADAAQARLQGAQAGWHDARVSVAAETANNYIALRTCRRLLAVTENDARSRAETSRLNQLSAEAGFTAPATAALSRASAAEGSARLTQQRAQCEIDLKTLAALTAVPEPALRERLETSWNEPGPAPLFGVTEVPAQVLAQRPDVFQAEREVAATSADVGAAQAQRYPRVSLTGSVAAGMVRLGGEWTDAQTWSLGPLAVTLPLFDAGRRAANADASRARYDEAVVAYRARLRQAVSEVEQALVNLDSARRRDEDARTAAEGYRASFAATEARFRGGLGSLFELEDARRTLLAAETALVTLQRERAAAWVALYRATGGGWRRDEAPAGAAR
ncbi:efflux transporter outer membrane subunit [Ramlibacter henchirensis]|uniref:Efflux transporter outer membrane subunit n=1 Tax=Ramlibacter henchirensis TaxID=204072 RepID=A0A4Z0C6D7_9BURK|nr:efflux transporter outer membrane subunit [Ramlibacter henchirensis]TFZ06851.1 efflux transporter outer membrane subunit [Ramlibacter henchirensis]